MRQNLWQHLLSYFLIGVAIILLLNKTSQPQIRIKIQIEINESLQPSKL
jgi:hypothetical protein